MGTSHLRAGLALALTLTLTLIATPDLARAQSAPRAPSAYPAGDATVEDIESVGRRAADLVWMQVEGAPELRIAYLLTDQSGTSPYTYRVRIPSGYQILPHEHQARMYVTVLRGTYLVGFGPTADRAHTVAFPAGSYIWLPKNSAHFGWTEGETVLQVHGNGPMKLDWMKNRER